MPLSYKSLPQHSEFNLPGQAYFGRNNLMDLREQSITLEPEIESTNPFNYENQNRPDRSYRWIYSPVVRPFDDAFRGGEQSQG
jgi:hypothetical protein